VAPRALHRLLNGDRHFTGLAVAEADAASAVADHRQRGEAKLTATLDHLGHAVDRNQLLTKPVAANLARRHDRNPCLELETGFARGIRQRLHPAVILEPGAVEGHLLDPCG